MGLDLTRAFVAVVRAGGFAEAGRTSNTPRSTLSRQVMRLEERLGVRLLQRTTRSIGLTEAGKALFRRCAPAIDAITEAGRDAMALDAAPRGVLTVACPFDAARDLLTPLLHRFHARYPDVSLQIRVSPRRVDLIAEGVDVAIRGGHQPDSSLMGRRLFAADLGFYASPSYLDTHGRPDAVADLAAHHRLDFAGPPGGWPLTTPAGTIRYPIDGWLVMNEWASLARVAADGGGVALILDVVAAPFVADGRLVRVLPDVHVEGGGLYVVFPTAQQLAPKVRVFVDFLVDHLTVDLFV